jgi:hypothetical protein
MLLAMVTLESCKVKPARLSVGIKLRDQEVEDWGLIV